MKKKRIWDATNYDGNFHDGLEERGLWARGGCDQVRKIGRHDGPYTGQLLYPGDRVFIDDGMKPCYLVFVSDQAKYDAWCAEQEADESPVTS